MVLFEHLDLRVQVHNFASLLNSTMQICGKKKKIIGFGDKKTCVQNLALQMMAWGKLVKSLSFKFLICKQENTVLSGLL